MEEDMEKWKRGELVEPKKPIVYYIDPATPKKWRKSLIAGINDWQGAFEKAGFKNAIMGKEWPEGDSTMSMEDARYSVLRYFASDVENAYGPNVHDPRSGEILESHIGWYHNVMKLLHNWYMIQTAAVNPRARKMKFEDSLMGELIRFVSSHEVGHTIGLLHNMGQIWLHRFEFSTYEQARRYAQANRVSLEAAQRHVLGIDQREVSGWLALHWGLGGTVTQAVSLFRTEQDAVDDAVCDAVHVGHVLGNALDLAGSRGSQVHALSPASCARLSIDWSQDSHRLFGRMEARYKDAMELTEASPAKGLLA